MATDFSMHSYKKQTLKTILALLFLLPLGALSQIAPLHGACKVQDNLWQINLQSQIQLQSAPIEALKGGLPLHFSYQILIKKERPLRNKTIHQETLEYQILYNHITQSWRLSAPNSQIHHFFHLHDALNHIAQALKDKPLLPLNALEQGNYQAEIKLQLQTEKLPFSLYINRLFNKEWQLESPWWTCTITK